MNVMIDLDKLTNGTIAMIGNDLGVKMFDWNNKSKEELSKSYDEYINKIIEYLINNQP